METINRKHTFDMVPSAISTLDGKWIVFFTMNSVEFATQPMGKEDAHWIMRIVRDRVGEWARGTDVWVEETDDTETASS